MRDEEGGYGPEERPPTEGMGEAAVETPVAGPAAFSRYRLGPLLGSGGMGKVYKAWDPRLRRNVALKFVTRGDAGAAARLILEAQAQAKVEHEHICKVYEVGEAGEQNFIAMQLIDGKTLGDLADELTLPEKIRVMEQAARAVHAAHRQGLVHRDLKPSNIMLERTEDGWKPFVMDFGVARELSSPGLTATGDLVGTPQYMAPEQARGGGEPGPPADVYGLGATLYRLLTGRPPYVGSSAEVLMQVLGTGEPSSVRQVAPALPLDLDTITAHCLEKDPARRYPSAAALAEDLRRYLDGEPIEARRASITYRLGKRARKNRQTLWVAAVALAAASLIGALWLRDRASARRRAALAQHYAEETERVGGDLRRAYTLPHHDVRPDKRAVRERLEALAREARAGGGASLDLAEHALGRGYLALEEPELARDHLERAWALGRRGPDAAFALGQAWGAIYRRRLLGVERIPDPAEREARRRELDATRDAALGWLRQGAGQGDDPAFGQAVIALYEKRYPEALAGARLARARVPWLYEASVVEGDAHTALSRERWGDRDYAAAAAEARLAVTAYGEAADIARSDPAVHAGMCASHAWLLIQDLRQGAPPDEHHAAAVRSCELAIGADPDVAAGHYEKLRVSYQWASFLLGGGKDPSAELDEALAQADRTLAIDPAMVEAYLGRGNVLRTRALWEARQGRDARPTVLEAVKSFETARALAPLSYMTNNDLGITWALMHQLEEQRGVDPRASIDRALAALLAARAANPRNLLPVENLAALRSQKAAFELNHGIDPRPTLRETIAILEQVAPRDRDPAILANLGSARLAAAEAEAVSGGDPRPDVEQARKAYAEALAVNASVGDVYQHLGEAELTLAQWQAGRDDDAGPALEAARQAARKAIELAANPPSGHDRLMRVELLAARLEMKAGRSPAPHLAAAEATLRAAGPRAAGDPSMAASEAQLHRLRAEWRLGRREPIDAEVAAGLAAAARGQRLNPQAASLVAAQGELELLSARARGDAAQARRAAADLQRALEMSPLLLGGELRPLLNEARKLGGE